MRKKNQLTMTKFNSWSLPKSNMKGVILDNSSLQPIAVIWVVKANLIIFPSMFEICVYRFAAKEYETREN